MARTRRCPICGKLCRVAADGKSGYCKSTKKNWERKKVPVSEIKPGPIRHAELPDFLLGVIRWTYSIVGHYIQPTLEQWELGFMRDMNVTKEVIFWHRLAFAFIAYHRRRNLPLRSDAEEQKLVGSFIALEPKEDVSEESEEEKLLRQCWTAPDGWDEEIARVQQLANLPDATWSPPAQLGNWPTS
jgi:hypothetical protein